MKKEITCTKSRKTKAIIPALMVIAAVFALIIGSNMVNAAGLELDSIQFDPAIIAAGDEVDIVVQYHVENLPEDEENYGQPGYSFKVSLVPDDSLTRKYVIIQDSIGDNIHGGLIAGEYYNKKFRVKVLNNAPAGNYEFKLIGRWYKNRTALPTERYIRFMMPVKKEGIIIDISNIETTPAEVRPGDDYVKIESYIENTGEKDAKSVEAMLFLPECFEASYSNNNRIWIGRLNAGESKKATFYIDIGDYCEDKVYNLSYKFNYMDTDDNSYKSMKKIPFVIKPKPQLIIVSSNGTGRAGTKVKLYITVKNTGKESAEAVDVRILKQNSQPFVIDVRSDYIGELKPNETGLAVFDIEVTKDAAIKEHNLKVLIRAKGDSDEGDDNIYTYNRRVKFVVSGEADNRLLIAGIAGSLAVVLIIIAKAFVKKRKA